MGPLPGFRGHGQHAPEDVFNPFNFRENFEPLLFLTIVAGMTFAGVNSFAEEKRSGALELILVTPIPINQIILGRVRGVWEQFLPAALILGSLDACLARIFGIAGVLMAACITARACCLSLAFF